MRARQAVLAQFEPDIAAAVIEFGKSLSRIKAGIFVFLARKSLYLYDVLLSAGIPPIEQCVVSDRVLDMRVGAVNGKNVALIDDTLIVETTVAKPTGLLDTD